MKNTWTQPSLSRDFAVLSAAVLGALLIISAWVTYFTYTRHVTQVAGELEQESQRIDYIFNNEMGSASYLLTAIGKQVVVNNEHLSLVRLAQLIKSFDSKNNLYSIISWIDANQKVVISSNHGILEKLVDVSDRDYVRLAIAEPWKMRIAPPIEGRVSGRWIIPVAMAITDYTGKFIGIVMISMDISMLTDHLSHLVKRDGISFAIVSKTLMPLTEVSDQENFVTNNFPTQKLVNVNFSDSPSGLLSAGSIFWGTRNYSYYRVSKEYPYIILLGYDPRFSDEGVRKMLWSSLGQLLILAAVFVLFLWIIRSRMIRPVLELTGITASIAQGQTYVPLKRGGPIEIEGLSQQIRSVADYIKETKRIEHELRNKMASLKQGRDSADLERRAKTEWLAYVCQQLRNPLSNIIGFSQMMRDEMYGPIENRRYQQYAADIYKISNALLRSLQELLDIAVIETGYGKLNEKPLSVADQMQKALRLVDELLQSKKLSAKTLVSSDAPKLLADELRLQQMLVNLIAYVCDHLEEERTLLLSAFKLNETRDKLSYALVISSDPAMATEAQLAALIQKPGTPPETEPQLTLDLAKIIASMHQANIRFLPSEKGHIALVVLFPAGRIHADEN